MTIRFCQNYIESIVDIIYDKLEQKFVSVTVCVGKYWKFFLKDTYVLIGTKGLIFISNLCLPGQLCYLHMEDLTISFSDHQYLFSKMVNVVFQPIDDRGYKFHYINFLIKRISQPKS